MEAVPNYWRKTASAQTVNMVMVPEVATGVAMLNTGQGLNGRAARRRIAMETLR